MFQIVISSAVISQNQVPPRCLFCYKKLREKDLKAREAAVAGAKDDVFLLKVLLQVPFHTLQNLVQETGSIPGRWVSVCGKCAAAGVAEAKMIYNDLLVAVKKFREVRSRIEETLNGSWPSGTKGIPEMGLTVTETCRRLLMEGIAREESIMVDDLVEIANKLLTPPAPEVTPVVVQPFVPIPLTVQSNYDGFEGEDEQLIDLQPENEEVKSENEDESECDESSVGGGEDPLGNDSDWKPSSPEEEAEKCQENTNIAPPMKKRAIEKPFSCSECDHCLVSHRALARHLSVVHKVIKPPKVWICKEAECKELKPFTMYLNYKAHQRRHRLKGSSTQKSLLTCPLCPAKLVSAKLVRKHVRQRHKNAEDIAKSIPADIHPCTWPNCDKTFTSSENLKDHISRHEGKPAYACSQCPAKFYTPQNRRRHDHAVHSGLSFKCDECDKDFSCKQYLQNHVLQKHKYPKKTQPAGIKKPKPSQTHKLKTRILGKVSHSGPTHYQCEHCGKQLKGTDHLKLHMLKFHEGGERQFKCDTCGREMWLRHELKIHKLRYHPDLLTEEEKKSLFQCDVPDCEKWFVRKVGLENHKKKEHEEKKMFQCQFCGKEFPIVWKLQQHEMLHTNQETRPFKCGLCGKGFANQHNLRYHELKTHKMQKKVVRQKEIRPRRQSKKTAEKN